MHEKLYYPIFADLNGRMCVVIGGGAVAQRKVVTLLGAGARVTVVSPTLSARLRRYARKGALTYRAREFRPSDLRGSWLAFAATDNNKINEKVFKAANRRRIFVNVVDQKPLCSFIAPSIFRRGPLTVAVSTGGSSPTIARRLRFDLERKVGIEYVPMLRLLKTMRGIAKRKLPDYHDRKCYFDRLVQGRVFALIRKGRYQQARQEALTLLDRCGRNVTKLAVHRCPEP